MDNVLLIGKPFPLPDAFLDVLAMVGIGRAMTGGTAAIRFAAPAAAGEGKPREIP